MELLVMRDACLPGVTLGTLSVNGAPFCQTLEDADRHLEDDPDAKVAGETAIPRGRYRVIVDASRRFGRDMPHILDVPGFEGVRIHPGNGPEDTEGCILVGRVRSGERILDSRNAFTDLFASLRRALDRGEDITLEVQ